MVAPLLPAGVAPDVIDGVTWVGLIPFHMRRVRIFGTPSLPYVSDFLETNVRLYGVGPNGRRGVVFRSLDADRLLPVLAARLSYRLPYVWSRMSLQESNDDEQHRITYTSTRRWPRVAGRKPPVSRLTVEVGEAVDSEPLDVFLTARWGLHSTFWGERTVYAPVSHERWPLRRATLLDLDETLITAAGLPAPTGEPRVLYSEGVHVRIGRPRPA